jgi:hypothetical protein
LFWTASEIDHPIEIPDLRQEMAIMKSGIARLREKIATNQELAAQLEQQLGALGSKTDARLGAIRRPRSRPKASRTVIQPAAATGIQENRPFQSIRNWYRAVTSGGARGGAKAEPLLQRPRSDTPADFDEDAYLFLNPDIATAVEQGLVPSGTGTGSLRDAKRAGEAGPGKNFR